MKALIWIIVILVVIGGIYWIIKSPSQPAVDNRQSSMMASTSDNTSGIQMEDGTMMSKDNMSMMGTSSQTMMKQSPKTVTVTYTDTGFSPKSVNIAVGDTVKFVNNSSKGMWVASAMHPSHKAYDGTDLQTHCAAGVTSSFDECKEVSKGTSYSFTFSKAGSWNYHNHSASSDYGTVVVK